MKSLLLSDAPTGPAPDPSSESRLDENAATAASRSGALGIEEALLEQAVTASTRSGRMEALRVLLTRYEPIAFTVTNVLLEERADAAVACEDACVEALGGLLAQTSDNASAFRIGLYRALHRHCERFPALQHPASNPKHRDFRAMVAGMDGSLRWMVVLKFVVGLDQRDIASVLDTPLAEVRSGLWSAMRRLTRFAFQN